MIFRIAEVVVAGILILIFLTQIVWPVLKGRALFPFFRKQRNLEKNLADANQAKYEAGLEKKVSKAQPHQPDNK